MPQRPDDDVLEPDWTGIEFAEILRRGQAHYPVSDALDGVDPNAPATAYEGVWYTSQRQHVLGWLRELDGPGAYSRKSRGLGARHFYQHFQCPAGLLWVAEALGEDPSVVQQAADVIDSGTRFATQCAALRRVTPWTRIAELALRAEPRMVERRRRKMRP